MRPDARDAATLSDLFNAALNIAGFTRSVTLDAYRSDLILRRAVERELSIIGEASRRASDTLRAQHSHLPRRLKPVCSHDATQLAEQLTALDSATLNRRAGILIKGSSVSRTC